MYPDLRVLKRHVARHMRETRGALRISQFALANAMGAVPASVNNWEQEHHCIGSEYLVALALLSGKSLDELVGMEELRRQHEDSV